MVTDNGQISAVCLLDLMAAFDGIDHELWLQRLDYFFHIKGLALSWFRSYVTGRTFCVVYTGMTSTMMANTCQFRRGSVLGPLLFILYTTNLSKLAGKRGATLNTFAADTQLQLHCKSITTATSTLKSCIAEVSCWMLDRHLKLNENKTELVNWLWPLLCHVVSVHRP